MSAVVPVVMPMPTPTTAVVWIHATHAAAEASVEQLQRGGLDMTKLSIVGADDGRATPTAGTAATSA